MVHTEVITPKREVELATDAGPLRYILAAHEIGHNFSAEHVDNRSGCANTIMQANLNNTGNTFCAFSRAQIEAHVTANSGCLALSGGRKVYRGIGASGNNHGANL